MHQIGVGVLGPVFRTYEPSEDRLVAVKVFHLDITPEQARTLVEALERLIATDLAHPGVVAPLAVGLEDDVPYLAQEYVAAESLDVAIRHYSPASVETALPFIRQTAAAVDAAHEQGVVHGALHLRDIFVTPDEARVTGFGVVRALEEVGLAGPIRRPYTAPEVIAGRGWDAAADRFALAAIAYELLTGRRAAGTGDQVTERIRSIEGVSDPEYLEEVFATALADDPEDRHSSANRFVLALELGVGEGPNDVASVGPAVDHQREPAPPDLLAGLELHQQDSSVEHTADPVERLESVAGDGDESTGKEDDDLVTPPTDQDVEPRVSAVELDESASPDQVDEQTAGDVADAVDSVEATRAEDAREDGVVSVNIEGHDEDAAGDLPDLEVIEGTEATDHPTVSDDRYVVDDQEGDDDGDNGDNEEYPDPIPVPPPRTEEPHRPRSVWTQGIVPVLAIAVVVGSVAYFLGVALAPNDGPTDQVLGTQTSLVGEDAGTLAVDAAGGAPARPSNSVPADGLSPASTPAETGSVTPPGTGPAEPPRVSSTPAGVPAVEPPGTQTARVPSPDAAAAPALPQVTPATGWVLVRTEPPGATVTLDGVGRGQTPLSLRDVSFGTHRLEVSRAGIRYHST